MFWSKPREALFRNLEEFNKSVNAVANLRQNMIAVQYQSTNPQMLFAMNSMVTPQVLANIQYATALLPKLGEHAGIPQLIVLISEAINIFDWKSASTLVERATTVKDATPALQSEALLYKARLMFLTGRLQEGRKAYEDALNVLRNESAFGINGSRANIAADWAIAEYIMGDCFMGNEQIRHFIEFSQHPQITPLARVSLIQTLKSKISETQSRADRCILPNEFDALN